MFADYPVFGGSKTTLVVPDVHCSLELLSEVESLVDSGSVGKLIWIGDYFNRFGQTGNASLYIETAERILALSHRVESVFLVGNHDIAYVLGRRYRDRYHADALGVRCACEAFFRDLQSRGLLYFYAEEGGYLFSHAGIKSSSTLPSSALVDLTNPLHIAFLDEVVSNDPSTLFFGRPSEWENEESGIQVFGHTPLAGVTPLSGYRIGVDSWSESLSLDPYRSTEEVVRTTRDALSRGEMNWQIGCCDLLVLPAGSTPVVLENLKGKV